MNNTGGHSRGHGNQWPAYRADVALAATALVAVGMTRSSRSACTGV